MSFPLTEIEKTPLLRCSPIFKEPAAQVLADHTQMLLERGGRSSQSGRLSSPHVQLTSQHAPSVPKCKVQLTVML